MESPINTRTINIPDEIVDSWQSIVNTLADIIHVPAALIMKVDRPFIEVFRSSQSEGNPYEVGDREHLAGLYCERVITTKERLLVPNALKDPEWVNNADVKLGMISYLGFPLVWPNGEVFGTICVLDAKENQYNEVYGRLLLQLRELVEAHLRLLYRERELEAVLAERKQVEVEIKRRSQELSALNAIAATVSESLELETILDATLDRVLGAMAVDAIGIHLVEGDRLDLRAYRNLPPHFVAQVSDLRVGESLPGLVAQTGEPIVIQEEVSRDIRLTKEAEREEGFQSFVCVPLKAKGKVVGVMPMATYRRREFSPEDVALLTAIGQQIGVAVENARLYEQTQQALGTKSALLQEMHHRIKNNLQAITGLLSLQLAYKESTTVEEVVRTTINRIRSIASVHESLSYDEVGSVGFRNLARRITELSREGMVQASQRVQVSFVGPDLKLPSKQATSLALVLNELAVNAIKHGFAGGRDGTITVRTSTEGDQMALEVLDDGLGLPEGFDPRQSSGLGLRIVEILVRRDLKGNFTLENVGGGGTRAVIAFPVEASKG